MEQLVGVDADAGDAHTGGHNGHRRSLVGAGVALDAPDVVHQLHVFQKALRDKVCPQGIAGHQHRFSKCAGRGFIVGSTHISPPLP